MRKMKRAMLSLALCTILVCGMSMTAFASTDKEYGIDKINELSAANPQGYCIVNNPAQDAKFHPAGMKLVSQTDHDNLENAWLAVPTELYGDYFEDDVVDAIIAAQKAIEQNAVTATGEYYISEKTWNYQTSLWDSINSIYGRVESGSIQVLEQEPDATYTKAWILEVDMAHFDETASSCAETQNGWGEREKLEDSLGNEMLNVKASEVDAANAKLKEAIDYFNSKLHNAAPVETPKAEESSGQTSVVKTPENDLGAFQSESVQKVTAAVKQISDAIAAGDAAKAESLKTNGVQIDTGIWYSFNKSVYEKIEKSGVPVTLRFTYKGKRYSVTIPAGANVTELCDETGWCGSLNLAAHYGFEYLSE